MAAGVPSGANFFSEPPQDVVFEANSSSLIAVSLAHNIGNTLNAGNPLVFQLPHVDMSCIDFNSSYLKFKLRIVNADGTEIDNAPRGVFPVNGIGHTVWKNIELLANDVPTTNSYQPYDYKKMIEHLLTADGCSDNYSELWGFKKRVNVDGRPAGGEHPISMLDRDTQRGQPHFDQDNPDLRNWYEFIVTPALDLFTCGSNIVSLDTVKWELRLTPHENIHALNWSCNWGNNLEQPNVAGVAASLNNNYKLEIESSSVKFYMSTMKLTPSAYSAAIETAQDGGFVYNYTPSVIKVETLNAEELNKEVCNFSPRANPVMYAHTFVPHAAYSGNKRYNPYNFSPPPSFTKFYNFCNGQSLGEEMPVDFRNGGGKAQLYKNNLAALGIDQHSRGLLYKINEADKGFWFKVISLFPTSDLLQLAPKTAAGIHSYRVELDNARDMAYTIITYIRYEDAQLKINLDGTVTNTFAPQ